MFKEKIVLHGLNLVGLAKIGGSFTVLVSTKSGSALVVFLGVATWFVVSNVLLQKAKKRYPRFSGACKKIRV